MNVSRSFHLFTLPPHTSHHPMLYSIGYQGLTVAQLKITAAKLDACVVDTRLVPQSRDAQWNKKRVAAVLGDRYVWAEGLGNINYKSDGPILLKDPEPWIEKIVEDVRAGRHIVLMCVCREHATCHRATVCDTIKQRHGIETIVLTAEKIRELTDTQAGRATNTPSLPPHGARDEQ